MTHEEAKKCYCMIKDTQFKELKIDLYKAAHKYATIRSEWAFMSNSMKLEKDQYRTISHNSFISICNALSRNMNKKSEDNSWRTIIGSNRKDIGDFACFLNCIIGLENA